MNLKIVNAVRDVGVTKGATGPHFMECDDGMTYLVKFYSVGSKVAVNEHLGHSLARAVTLPSPRSVLVEVSAEMIAHSGDMRNRGIAPGQHQGSEAVPNSSDLAEFESRHGRLDEELVNAEVLPGTICLDNWILTEDRDRAENHLLQAVPGGFRYHMVDFTHSFTGTNWTADSLEQGSYLRVLMPTLPQAAESVRGLTSLESMLRKIEKVQDSAIEEVVAAVPAAWNVTPEERLTLISFLELRRGLLRSLLTSNKDRFTNWTD